MSNLFQINDLVRLKPSAFGQIRLYKFDFPWKVIKIEGDLVTIERISAKTGKKWRSRYHYSSLVKIQ